MLRTKLVVRDHVNCTFVGLNPAVRRKICDALKFAVPGAKYTPQFKLGRWDGTVSFCTINGATYLNLLDRILPIIMEAGYDIDIDDKRQEHKFDFAEPTDQMFADRQWPLGHPLAGEPIVLRDYQVDAIRRYLDNLQSVQEIATGAGKCVDFNTEIAIEIDETSEFGKYLLNTVDYQEISTGEGFCGTSTDKRSEEKLD